MFERLSKYNIVVLGREKKQSLKNTIFNVTDFFLRLKLLCKHCYCCCCYKVSHVTTLVAYLPQYLIIQFLLERYNLKFLYHAYMDELNLIDIYVWVLKLFFTFLNNNDQLMSTIAQDCLIMLYYGSSTYPGLVEDIA